MTRASTPTRVQWHEQKTTLCSRVVTVAPERHGDGHVFLLRWAYARVWQHPSNTGGNATQCNCVHASRPHIECLRRCDRKNNRAKSWFGTGFKFQDHGVSRKGQCRKQHWRMMASGVAFGLCRTWRNERMWLGRHIRNSVVPPWRN